MQLEDWLDDLCVRFIVNLPPEELASVERICFQVEEAQWFYEDFVRPLDPSLPSLSLKAFSLRIFQHCPLFSTWSMQHYTSAFAEFLAYKQRVPVRGAIMLNEEMDEVVLVKGWKKGANWSFPRGKINKDENDLDCAIREVYEETGYDIKAAGLVKPEKDMKYIEITMREQHMRLYVFRGVPKDTHFEPKTRKEISKIEWYKLTDLPTLKKKHAQHDTQDENPALNANKFYMVAPFLHPLKKWIAQQKKRENRYSSSHLAAPPMIADESATEGEPGPITYAYPEPKVLSPQVPSSLPEVASVQDSYSSADPSLHLKELLRIGAPPQQAPPAVQPIHMPNADPVKSNALLSLLRQGPMAEMRASPHTPSEQLSFPQQNLQPSQGFFGDERSSASLPQSHPHPSLQADQAQVTTQQQSLLNLLTKASNKPPTPPPNRLSGMPQLPTKSAQQPPAPYQRTGDPEFSRDSPEDTRIQVVPPANALPKLTHHTRALLDAFKSPLMPPMSPQQPLQSHLDPPLAPDRQALLDVFKKPALASQRPISPAVSATATLQGFSSAEAPYQATAPKQALPVGQAPSSNASALLNLFKSHGQVATSSEPKSEPSLQAPVELAAGPVLSPKPQYTQSQTELLSALLRKDAPKRVPQATKAGETAATLEGPLNQPHFQGLTKSPSQLSSDSMRRSPVPAHRTLFDPKQPTPTKILQRAEDGRRNLAKSPRPSKANPTVQSPKHKARSRPEKSFQPQILKRPQNPEVKETITSSPVLLASPGELPDQIIAPLPPSPPTAELPMLSGLASPPFLTNMTSRTAQQTESQKQNLLSLLTGQPGGLNLSKTPRQLTTSSGVSPLTQSQLVSPLGEEPPISTRSRMGSLVSVPSAITAPDGRSKVEKRQTTADDKAFLLGYLGRIASQEGQAP